MTVAVVTAIFGGYEVLKPNLQQTVPVEWVCVTDDPTLAADPRGWRVVVDPPPARHPNRSAKAPKMDPTAYVDADVSVWIDGSFAVRSDRFVADMLDLLTETDLAQFEHPWRSCIYDEAAASVAPKYVGEPITEQVEHYRAAGHPAGWGLWATGIIARRHTPAVVAWGRAWASEIDQWSFQDQLSHPVVCRGHDLRPASIPGTHLVNPWLAYQGSDRH